MIVDKGVWVPRICCSVCKKRIDGLEGYAYWNGMEEDSETWFTHKGKCDRVFEIKIRDKIARGWDDLEKWHGWFTNGIEEGIGIGNGRRK